MYEQQPPPLDNPRCTRITVCSPLSPQHRDGGGDPGPGRLPNMGHLVQCPQIHTYRGDGHLCDCSMDNVDITEKGKKLCHVQRA